MPRGRMLNKKIVQDEKVAKLSLKSTLFYTWCIPFLDFEGRLMADVWSLKSLFPFISEVTTRNIPYLIKELIKADLVTYYERGVHKYLQFKGFKTNQTLNKLRESPSIIPTPTPDELQSSVGAVQDKLHVKSKLNVNVNLSKGNVVYKEILDDLNSLLKTSYKHSSKNTQSLINARIEEGHLVADFKKVHRNMATAWSKDTKMCQYLRPQTLYGTKFESYLNIQGAKNGRNKRGFEKDTEGKYDGIGETVG